MPNYDNPNEGIRKLPNQDTKKQILGLLQPDSSTVDSNGDPVVSTEDGAWQANDTTGEAQPVEYNATGIYGPGFTLDSNGLYATNAYIEGEIIASSGQIANWIIVSDGFYNSNGGLYTSSQYGGSTILESGVGNSQIYVSDDSSGKAAMVVNDGSGPRGISVSMDSGPTLTYSTSKYLQLLSSGIDIVESANRGMAMSSSGVSLYDTTARYLQMTSGGTTLTDTSTRYLNLSTTSSHLQYDSGSYFYLDGSVGYLAANNSFLRVNDNNCVFSNNSNTSNLSLTSSASINAGGRQVSASSTQALLYYSSTRYATVSSTEASLQYSDTAYWKADGTSVEGRGGSAYVNLDNTNGARLRYSTNGGEFIATSSKAGVEFVSTYMRAESGKIDMYAPNIYDFQRGSTLVRRYMDSNENYNRHVDSYQINNSTYSSIEHWPTASSSVRNMWFVSALGARAYTQASGDNIFLRPASGQKAYYTTSATFTSNDEIATNGDLSSLVVKDNVVPLPAYDTALKTFYDTIEFNSYDYKYDLGGSDYGFIMDDIAADPFAQAYLGIETDTLVVSDAEGRVVDKDGGWPVTVENPDGTHTFESSYETLPDEQTILVSSYKKHNLSKVNTMAIKLLLEEIAALEARVAALETP